MKSFSVSNQTVCCSFTYFFLTPFSQTLQVLISLFHLFCCPGCTHTLGAFPQALPKTLSSKRPQKPNASVSLPLWGCDRPTLAPLSFYRGTARASAAICVNSLPWVQRFGGSRYRSKSLLKQDTGCQLGGRAGSEVPMPRSH